MSFVLAIDQGTSATKALVADSLGRILSVVEEPVLVKVDAWGGVEVDPLDLWTSLVNAGRRVLDNCGSPPISAVGLANQGESVLAWSKKNGNPMSQIISWQDRRSITVCHELGYAKREVEDITGMTVDPYFVAPKIRWLENSLVDRPQDMVITTTDVWLLNRLCGSFSTDVSTASRTLLTDLNTLDWSSRCLEIFRIGHQHLPAIHDNDAFIGSTRVFGGDVPVVGTCVDQQAALFAEGCHSIGETKCTYGTGAFLLANSGSAPKKSKNGLTPCAAWRFGGQTSWCLDGQVYTAGSAISWLIEIGILPSAKEIDILCQEVDKSSAPIFVPSLAGLAAPWWKPSASGQLSGLNLATTREQIVFATLFGIAAQIAELATAVKWDLQAPIRVLKVDGGLARSEVLLQTQADLMQCVVQPFPSAHATALGIAQMSLLAQGEIDTEFQFSEVAGQQRIVEPSISADQAEAQLATWRRLAEQIASQFD